VAAPAGFVSWGKRRQARRTAPALEKVGSRGREEGRYLDQRGCGPAQIRSGGGDDAGDSGERARVSLSLAPALLRAFEMGRRLGGPPICSRSASSARTAQVSPLIEGTEVWPIAFGFCDTANFLLGLRQKLLS